MQINSQASQLHSQGAAVLPSQHAVSSISTAGESSTQKQPESPENEIQGVDRSATGAKIKTDQVPAKPQDIKNPIDDPSSAEYAQIKELAARDREVRAHEQAHLGAAGQYATGGASFSFQSGPDGQHYAVGGEVGIDVSAIADDPEATIAKMQVIQRAASAPAEPSGQDMRVAANAAQVAAAARAELASAAFEESQVATEEAASQQAPEETPAPLSSNAKTATQSYHDQQQSADQQQTPELFRSAA